MKTTLRTVLATLLLLAAARAPADEVAEARAKYEQGASLYRAGKYRESIPAFEAAYRLKPHGDIHFNVAQCREKLGEWPAALRAYQDYLRELPEARDRAAVRASIGRIEQRLASAGVQALLVYTDPPGAAVRLDGKARGRTPFHITLPPGAYRVALSLDGFAPEELEAEVNLAASRLVEVVLRPQGAKQAGAAVAVAGAAKPLAPPAAGASPAAAAAPVPASSMSSGVPVAVAAAKPAPDLSAPPPTASPLAVPAPQPTPPAQKPTGWTTRRILAWASAAVAVAAVGVAVSQGLQAEDLSSQLKDGNVRPAAEADALARDATSKAKSANVLYGVGAAAAAAGATLFVLEGRF
jgi:hypothetical protein